MSKPTSYRIQHGCHNCGHCFIKTDYDQGPEYFCTFGAPPRPQCSSVAMDECKTSHDEDEDWNAQFAERTANYELWHEWSMPREVEPFGICEHHELQKMASLAATDQQPKGQEWSDETCQE